MLNLSVIPASAGMTQGWRFSIWMVNKKAVVDEAKCAGCLHCLGACGEGAIPVLAREEPLILGIDIPDRIYFQIVHL